MKYQFCYGPSGAGKSRYLQELVLQEAAGELADFAAMTGCGEPGFSNYLYVVPEQYTMQTQKDLVSRAACRGIMNVDVLSFGRLAHRIFEETGEDGRAVLDDVGKSLILRRLAGKYRKDLAVIGSRIDSLGMISEVKSQISEFMQYDLSPEDVEKLSAYAGAKGQGALAARLKDLEVLYRAFLEDGKDRFVTGEETYDILAEAIPKSQLVKNSVVVFDGFTGFTPVQVRVLGAIMRQAKKVIFSITAGEDGGPSFTEIDADTPLEEQDLFYLSRKTMRDIVRLGERLGVPREKDLSLLGSSRRYDNSPELCHLEKSLFRHPVSPWKGVPSRIHLFEASSQEEEVRQVFLSIGRLVREQGLAYRDIGIVAGDLSAYADLFTEAAEREKVPVYLDQNRAVRDRVPLPSRRPLRPYPDPDGCPGELLHRARHPGEKEVVRALFRSGGRTPAEGLSCGDQPAPSLRRPERCGKDRGAVLLSGSDPRRGEDGRSCRPLCRRGRCSAGARV